MASPVSPDIRETEAGDAAALASLHARAFPDEDLRPLVASLLSGPVDVLSLTVRERRAPVAHVVFTPCGGEGRDALLGPLAVLPGRQGRGLGSALVRAGLDMLRDRGTDHVFVLGDPAYYARFGFAPERETAAPFDLPEAWRDAWQSLTLSDAPAPKAKRLAVPEPWRDPALWGA